MATSTRATLPGMGAGLGQVDGAEVVTVEDLVQADGTLHPVQAALVEKHGSQCGFCTPGFVMSAYAYLKNGGGSAEDAEDAARMLRMLSGTAHRVLTAVAIQFGERFEHAAAVERLMPA